MLPIFTAIHPLVDACSMGVLVAGGITWQRAMAYNAIAFALQFPLGVALDACPRLTRHGFLFGTCLVAATAILASLGLSGWCVLAAACFGNALFHLAAGKWVLEAKGGRSGPIGLFISTGALGLMAGQIWAAKAASVALPAFAAALAACLVVAVLRGRRAGGLDCEAKGVPPMTGKAAVSCLILVGLFALIAWRSWAALFAGGRSASAGTAMLMAGAAVTWAGKAAGGYLAERAGRWPIVAASVCGSAILAFLCRPEDAAAWLALLFVAQLATGPVLSLVHERTGGMGGTAFGLNCLGLFTGSLA